MRAAEKSRGRPSWSLHPDSPLSRFPDPPSAHTSTLLSSAPGSLSHTGTKSSPLPSPPCPVGFTPETPVKHDHVRHTLFNLPFSPRTCNRHLSAPDAVLVVILRPEQTLTNLLVRPASRAPDERHYGDSSFSQLQQCSLVGCLLRRNPQNETCRVGKVKESEVAQSCQTLCEPMDCSPPDSSVHGIFQAGY